MAFSHAAPFAMSFRAEKIICEANDLRSREVALSDWPLGKESNGNLLFAAAGKSRFLHAPDDQNDHLAWSE